MIESLRKMSGTEGAEALQAPPARNSSILRKHKNSIYKAFRIIDVLIITFSFFLLYPIRFKAIDTNGADFLVLHQSALPVSLIVWIYLSRNFRLYFSGRFVKLIDESVEVAKATASCAVIASVTPLIMMSWMTVTGNAALPMSSFYLSLRFFAELWMLQASLLILFRFTLRKTITYIRSRGCNYRQVIIIGRNARAAKVATTMEETSEFGVRVLGFIDAPNGQNCRNLGYNFKVLGTLEDLERIVREQVVDEVFITLPIKSFYSEIKSIIELCETVGIEAKIPTDLFNLTLSKSTVSHYLDLPVIDLYTSPKMNWQIITKRFIDITLSALLLVLLLPLLLSVALLIKATSRGPVFFKQQRVGYNYRFFTLIKFRTMVRDAEKVKKKLLAFNEMEGPVFKMKNDPRITPIGRLLRKTSIDELPQLINVLRGDMSLVGPRPPLPGEVNQYDLSDRRRLSMKPGITCIWQVNGRNSIPFKKWMEMDRQYIDQWSLWLDFKILLKTIPAVLKGSGAS